MTARSPIAAIRRRARGRRTFEAVLDSAARAIRRGGVAELSVEAVMRDAGKTVGGFYNLFPSKEALADAAVRHLLALTLQLFEHCAADRQPAEGVVAYVDYYLSPAHCREPLRGCPLPALVSDLPRLAPEIQAHADTTVASLAAAIAAKLTLADITPRMAISSVLAEMVGALALARITADPGRAAELLGGARASVLNKLGFGDRQAPGEPWTKAEHYARAAAPSPARAIEPCDT